MHLCVKQKQRCAIWLENGSLQGIVSTVAKMLLPRHGTLNNAPQGCSRAPLGRRKVCFHSQTHRRSLLPLHLGQKKNDGQPQAFCSSFIKHERLFSRANQMEMQLSCFQKVGNSGHFVSTLLFFHSENNFTLILLFQVCRE